MVVKYLYLWAFPWAWNSVGGSISLSPALPSSHRHHHRQHYEAFDAIVYINHQIHVVESYNWRCLLLTHIFRLFVSIGIVDATRVLSYSTWNFPIIIYSDDYLFFFLVLSFCLYRKKKKRTEMNKNYHTWVLIRNGEFALHKTDFIKMSCDRAETHTNNLVWAESNRISFHFVSL